MAVDDDSLVVRLEGWRVVWAGKRTLRVPLKAVISAQRDPDAHLNIKTRLRHRRRPHRSTFRLGVQHSMDGWSFWSCGMGRNAVVFETVGIRYRFIVVEVADPERVVRAVQSAAGIETPKPSALLKLRPRTRKRQATPTRQGDRSPDTPKRPAKSAKQGDRRPDATKERDQT